MRFKYSTFIALCFVFITNTSIAGLIDSDSVLLDDTGATQIENWLGLGDLDWNSVWYGGVGSTSSSWQNAVQGIENTVSLYSVTSSGVDYIVGGFNINRWDVSTGYQNSTDNFIFNITSNTMHTSSNGHWGDGVYSVYNNINHFATFGGGYDLFGGNNVIGGTTLGYSNYYGTFNGPKNSSKGNIITNTAEQVFFTVNSLETFTFSPAVLVPEKVSEPPVFFLLIMFILLYIPKVYRY